MVEPVRVACLIGAYWLALKPKPVQGDSHLCEFVPCMRGLMVLPLNNQPVRVASLIGAYWLAIKPKPVQGDRHLCECVPCMLGLIVLPQNHQVPRLLHKAELDSLLVWPQNQHGVGARWQSFV
jgi:hypothetical protein